MPIEIDEVVEVAAELEAGHIASGNVERRQVGLARGQETALHVGGQLELPTHALVFPPRLVEPGVFDGGGEQVRHRMNEVDLKACEARHLAGEKLNEADGLALVDHACAEHGHQALALGVLGEQHTRVRGHVFDIGALALQGLAVNLAFVEVNPGFVDVIVGQVVNRPGHEGVVLLAVDHADDRALDVHHLGHRTGGRLENLLQVAPSRRPAW